MPLNNGTAWSEDWDDEDIPHYRRKHKAFRCVDRSCGALDCKTCHPENFDKHGRPISEEDESSQD